MFSVKCALYYQRVDILPLLSEDTTLLLRFCFSFCQSLVSYRIVSYGFKFRRYARQLKAILCSVVSF
jgi:hypothetical protein